MRAPDWIRTSGLGLRRAARFPCATRAWSGCGEIRTPTATPVATALQAAGPTSCPTHPWGDCPGTIRDHQGHNLVCTAGTPQPPWDLAYPRPESNWHPPVCRTGAHPIRATRARAGTVPAAGVEPAPSRLIRTLPYQLGDAGMCSGGRGRTCTLRINNPLPCRLGDAGMSSLCGTRTRSLGVKTPGPSP
jgi:hypothetical protein